MEENIKSGFFGEDETYADSHKSAQDNEEVDAAHRWGCNQYKCMPGCLNGKGTTREPKDTKQPRLFRVDQNADLHTQIVQLTEAIEKAEEDGVRLEAVITRPEFGELTLQCGNSGSPHPNGVKHAFEERHHISAKDLAELLLTGEVKQSTKNNKKLIVKNDSFYAILAKKEKKQSNNTPKQEVKLITATRGKPLE